MTPTALEAIISGTHGDPFSVLGPHETNTGWEVRAFLPQAAEVSVEIPGRGCTAMKKVHAQGFFVATLGENPGHYKFCLKLWNDAELLIEDPYRFPPLL